MNIVWNRPMDLARRQVCLTIDDGPNGSATERVLDVLRAHGRHATFFLIGQNVERYPHLARRIVDEGHEVGNHGYDDLLLPLASTKCIRRNLSRTSDVIVRATGQRPRFFRPPYGVMTPRLLSVCRAEALTPVGVHAFVGDSFLTQPRAIAKMILTALGGRSGIVVLHDGFGTYRASFRKAVGAALEIIIPELDELGYRWVGPETFGACEEEAPGDRPTGQ